MELNVILLYAGIVVCVIVLILLARYTKRRKALRLRVNWARGVLKEENIDKVASMWPPADVDDMGAYDRARDHMALQRRAQAERNITIRNMGENWRKASSTLGQLMFIVAHAESLNNDEEALEVFGVRRQDLPTMFDNYVQDVLEGANSGNQTAIEELYHIVKWVETAKGRIANLGAKQPMLPDDWTATCLRHLPKDMRHIAFADGYALMHFASRAMANGDRDDMEIALEQLKAHDLKTPAFIVMMELDEGNVHQY